jgi:hypothetical protein
VLDPWLALRPNPVLGFSQSYKTIFVLCDGQIHLFAGRRQASSKTAAPI